MKVNDNYKPNLILLLFSVYFCLNVFQPLYAQDTLILDLDRCIEIALKRSIRIKQLTQGMEWAEFNLWAAKAGYRTNISASLFAPAYEEGFTLVDVVDQNPIAKHFGQYRVQGMLDVTQPMPWIPLGGADLTFRSQAYQLNSWTPLLDNPDIELKSTKFFTSLSVIVNKPLFTINELAFGLKQAQLAFERQSSYFNRGELNLIFDVTQSFYALYSLNKRVDIDKDKVKRQEAIYQTTLNKYQVGLIAEVDAMQAEVELTRYKNDLKKSEGQSLEQEAAFKQLIGLNWDGHLNMVADLEIKPISIDVSKAIQLALQNRSELKEQEIEIEEQKIRIKEIDARIAIKGNLRGYYDLSGFSDPDLPWGTHTQDLFISSWETLQKTPNRGFTFELELPIWDWGRNRAQVKAAKANLKQAELEIQDLRMDIQREVKNAVHKVYETWDRVQMLEKSQKVSEKSFEISVKRFENGDITSTELARANEQYNETKMDYLSAFVEYRLSLADLERKTLYDFKKDLPLVR